MTFGPLASTWPIRECQCPSRAFTWAVLLKHFWPCGLADCLQQGWRSREAGHLSRDGRLAAMHCRESSHPHPLTRIWGSFLLRFHHEHTGETARIMWILSTSWHLSSLSIGASFFGTFGRFSTGEAQLVRSFFISRGRKSKQPKVLSTCQFAQRKLKGDAQVYIFPGPRFCSPGDFLQLRQHLQTKLASMSKRNPT